MTKSPVRTTKNQKQPPAGKLKRASANPRMLLTIQDEHGEVLFARSVPGLTVEETFADRFELKGGRPFSGARMTWRANHMSDVTMNVTAA